MIKGHPYKITTSNFIKDNFDLPVFYKGDELMFNSKLLVQRNTHKIQVDVFGEQVMLEPDEERNYRALIDIESMDRGSKINLELLKAIAASIEAIVK